MKTKLLFILSLLFTTTSYAQQAPYYFSQFTDAYSPLSGATSLNNGTIWDDPEYAIPIGFTFKLFDKDLTEIYIDGDGQGCLLTDDTTGTGVVTGLIPFMPDIIDRGYLDGVSLSEIRYALTGNPGSRILKIEWENVGFYQELIDDTVSTDYISFQLWLYETSNVIELRIGPGAVTYPSLSYDGAPGPGVLMVRDYDVPNDSLIGLCWGLEGSPAVAQFNSYSEFFNYPSLTGDVQAGTVYRFANVLTGLDETLAEDAKLRLYPNPGNRILRIAAEGLKSPVERTEVWDLSGRLVYSIEGETAALDVSALQRGMYLIKVYSQTGERLTGTWIKS